MRSAVCCVVLSVLARWAVADPDFARAGELYKLANQEMTQGKYAEAARDFGAAYDITKDPVLFYKIGSANEKAGRCDVALIYYGRYVKEARPDAKYLGMVKERMVACGGDPRYMPTPDPKPPEPPKVEPPKVEPPKVEPPKPAEPPAPPPAAAEGGHRDGAWLMVGGSLALVTAGAVLAYSASSSEQDLKDLYVGLNGVPPTFDANTQKRYNDLVDEGHRYQYLSWSAFGLAGACAIGAVIMFSTGHHDEHASITPYLGPRSGGIAVRF